MYPLLSKLPKAPASLTPELQTILLAAGHVAAGDAGGTVSAFRHIDKKLHGKAYELTIMQAAPIVGIPRTLHSAAALQTFGIEQDFNNNKNNDNNCNNTIVENLKEIREQGQDTFGLVYGRNETRVRQRLRSFHPRLDDWIITCVYGWTWSQSHQQVTLRERELATVAMLSVDMCAGVQLASHIRGAINTGATSEEVEAVIRQTQVVCEAAAPGALAVWNSYHRARYAL